MAALQRIIGNFSGSNSTNATATQSLLGAGRTFADVSRTLQADERIAQEDAAEKAKAGRFLRTQEWVEGAPQRAVEAEQQQFDLNIGRNQDKQQEAAGISKGLSHMGAERFDDAAIENLLSQDQRYQALPDTNFEGFTQEQRDAELSNPTTKLGFRNKFILDNPGAGADPSAQAANLRSVLSQSGKFSETEIDNRVSKHIGNLFPGTLSEEMQKSLITAFKPPASATKNYFGGATGSPNGGSGNFKNQFDIGNADNRSEVVSRFVENRGLDNTPSTWPFTDSRRDIGNLDPAGSDLDDLLGKLSASGIVSTTASEAAISTAFATGGDTIKPSYDWRNPEGFKKVLETAQAAQDAETQKFNSKNGTAFTNLEMAAAQAAQSNYAEQVKNILAGGSPSQDTDAEFANSFLSGLPGQVPSAAATTTTDTVAPVVAAGTEDTKAGSVLSQLEADATPAVQETENAPPGSGTTIFPKPAPEKTIKEKATPVLEQELAETQDKLTIFGNGKPDDKKKITKLKTEITKRKNAERVSVIETELQAMPLPFQRSLAQTAYARSLEKELNDLKR